jgi:hypothetical protein
MMKQTQSNDKIDDAFTILYLVVVVGMINIQKYCRPSAAKGASPPWDPHQTLRPGPDQRLSASGHLSLRRLLRSNSEVYRQTHLLAAIKV